MKKHAKLAAALMVVGGLAVVPQSALAGILTYGFTFDVGGDPLVTAGNPFSGTFSYNDTAGVVGFGGETTYALTAFSFDFLNGGLGALFGLANDPLATALWGWDGNFVGISYNATIGADSITFMAGNPGFAPIIPSNPSVASFSYSLDGATYTGNSNAAPIFTLLPAASVPEPSVALAPGLTLLLGSILAFRRRRLSLIDQRILETEV